MISKLFWILAVFLLNVIQVLGLPPQVCPEEMETYCRDVCAQVKPDSYNCKAIKKSRTLCIQVVNYRTSKCIDLDPCTKFEELLRCQDRLVNCVCNKNSKKQYRCAVVETLEGTQCPDYQKSKDYDFAVQIIRP